MAVRTHLDSRLGARFSSVMALLGVLCFALHGAAAATCTHPQGNQSPALWGDLDANGTVNIADTMCALLLSLEYLASPTSPELPTCLKVPPALADVGCDGAVNTADVQDLVRSALGVAVAHDDDGDGCADACEPCAEAGASSCLIEAACVPEGTISGADACRWCDPATSDSTWSARPDDSPCGGGMICQSGTCVADVPDAPTSVVGSVVDEDISLSFSAPASNGAAITSYMGECVPAGGGAAVTGTAAASPVVVTGLMAGSTYACRVRATNAMGPSEWSEPTEDIVLLDPPTLVADTFAGYEGIQATLDVLSNDTGAALEVLSVAVISPADGSSAAPSADGSAVVFTPNAATTYTLEYTAVDGPSPAATATITVTAGPVILVTTAVDEDNGTGDTSLREAIGLAVAAPGALISFDPTLPQTDGEIVIPIENTELAIPSSATVVIDSNGLPVALDAEGDVNADNRHFNMASSATLELRGLTLRGGRSPGTGYPDGGGGSIFVFGTLKLVDCVFEDNFANGHGGAVYIASGVLEIDGTLFQNNVTIGVGGAFYTGNGPFTARNSQFIQNTSISSWGGAINVAGGSNLVESCFFDGNHAEDEGGAIGNTGSSLVTITGSTFIRNSAVEKGGALYPAYGSMEISDSVIAGNSADEGGAIYGLAGGAGRFVNLTDTLVTGNNASVRGGAAALEGNFTLNVQSGSSVCANRIGGTVLNMDDPPTFADGNVDDATNGSQTYSIAGGTTPVFLPAEALTLGNTGAGYTDAVNDIVISPICP